MKVLRDHQVEMVDGAIEATKRKYKKILMQMPTGGGKTMVAAELIRRCLSKGLTALFLADSRFLVYQAAARFADYGLEPGIVMAGERPTGGPLQVASKDTIVSRLITNEWWQQPPPADVVFIDECRSVRSAGYTKLMEWYPDAYHIGLDATPVRTDGKGLGEFYQTMIRCRPTADLIRDGYLVPLKGFAPKLAAGKKRVVGGDPVAHWKQYAEGRPTILFTRTVKQSRARALEFMEAGIAAEHMDAHTPDNERKAMLDRLESGKTRVLCNDSVMGEGADVPCLGAVILDRVYGSYSAFCQAVGRIMRPFEYADGSKKYGIILDHGDNLLDHGYPDEHVEWPLERDKSVDQANKSAMKEGKKSKPIQCRGCGCIFRGTLVCPECGTKAAVSTKAKGNKAALLTEVGRDAGLFPEQAAGFLRERMIAHWKQCLAVMANRGQTFNAAVMMYKRKYNEAPRADFPCVPKSHQWMSRIDQVYPGFKRGIA